MMKKTKKNKKKEVDEDDLENNKAQKINENKNGKSKEEVAKRLESGGRILSLIRKAETKRVAKKKL